MSQRFGVLLLLFITLVVNAAETTVKVDLSGLRNQQHSISPGKVTLELSPLVPKTKYVITGLPEFESTPADASGDANADVCKDPLKLAWGLAATAKTETEVAEKLTQVIGRSSACTDLKERENAAKAVATVRSALTHTVSLKTDVAPPLTVEVKRGTDVWTLFLVRGPESDPDLLNEIEKQMEADERITVTECSYPEGRCETDPLFVNADHISAIVFRGVPTGNRLRVTADPMGEPIERCEVLRQNSMSWTSSPDVVVVTLHMFRSPFNFFGVNRDNRRAAALRLYGWTDLPRTLERDELDSLCETGLLPDDPKTGTTNNGRSSDKRIYERESALTGLAAARDWIQRFGTANKPVNAQRALIRGRGNQIEEFETIPIIADGTSEQVRVKFEFDGEPPKTFIIKFFYRRWWVDAGGAFLFPHVDEDRLETEAQSDGKVKVVDIEQKAKAKPETGIVINLHPGNYPEFAIQFGMSTGEESALSYYLGPAIRLQEIGKRGLATFSFGATLTPTQRFPDLTIFDSSKSATDTTNGFYPAADARLLGIRDYELHWYVGISLGFNFGGVIAGADAVKTLPD